MKCFFPVELKKKKKKKKKALFSFCNFRSFHFQFSTPFFTVFLLFFSILPPFPFFLASFFLVYRSAEISRPQVSGGTVCPTCYATVRPCCWVGKDGKVTIFIQLQPRPPLSPCLIFSMHSVPACVGKIMEE